MSKGITNNNDHSNDFPPGMKNGRNVFTKFPCFLVISWFSFFSSWSNAKLSHSRRWWQLRHSEWYDMKRISQGPSYLARCCCQDEPSSGLDWIENILARNLTIPYSQWNNRTGERFEAEFPIVKWKSFSRTLMELLVHSRMMLLHAYSAEIRIVTR